MHLAWGLFVFIRKLGLLLVLFASRRDRDLLVKSTVSSFSIHFMWDRMQQEQPLLLRLLARIPADLLIWGFQRRRSSGVERVAVSAVALRKTLRVETTAPCLPLFVRSVRHR